MCNIKDTNKLSKKNLATEKVFLQVKTLLINAKNHVVQTVNTTMVYTYFEIGRIIIENEQGGKERAKYNKQTLKKLSKQLTGEFGKGFSVDNLENMRRFYIAYQKSETPSRISHEFTLSWSHYVLLMRLDETERNFYENETAKNNWSLRELKRQYDSSLFERIVLSRDKKGVLEDNLKKYHEPKKSEDVVKDPYVLEFLGLEEKNHYTESDLEQAIINKIEQFLLELGKGFSFVARQKRITFDEDHYFIDLVFYNRLLKCFVLIELKIGKIKHKDIGQMQMYVNYYDRKEKTEEENPTIGILLCKDKNDTLVEMTLPKENNQIFASKYKLYLPTKEELKKQMLDI